MSANTNVVVLTGNITRDPELRFLPGSGTACTEFSIAVNRGYGEKKEVSFVNIVTFGKSAEAVSNYCNKGSKVSVVGELSIKSYDAKDGTKKTATKIIANQVEFLTSKLSQSQSEDPWGTPEDMGEDPF